MIYRKPKFPSNEQLKGSLSDKRHSLSHDFTPEFDYELWENTVQGGNTKGAETLQKQLLIKYADYPRVKAIFAKLRNRPFAVDDLGAYNPFHGLLFDLGDYQP